MYKFILIFCINILFTNLSYATSLDKLKITSDKLTIHKDIGTANFSGRVNVIFDDLQLSTAILKVIYNNVNNTKEIKKIIMPTTLTVMKNCRTDIVTANSGIFDNSTKQLTLIGNVRMYKEGNILITKKLIYSSSF